jgi:sulfite reductase (NADPH) hemoprotein beta-component
MSDKLTHNEIIKDAIPTLAGNISATIDDPEAAKFDKDDEQFLKFHGIYQQDDRDTRKQGKHWMLMVRGRIPAGVLTSDQYKTFDTLASEYGNNTLRVTTRQSIQFHGILKSGVRKLIKSINDSLLSTLAACGDVNRNVMAPPTPAYTPAREQLFTDSKRVMEALTPQTKAYHAIWIDGVQLDLEDEANKTFVDPLYGKTYLPRKFKVGLVIPPLNDIDVFTQCMGFIAIVENDKVVGYNMTAGGGMGRSHNQQETYPRLADVIGFFTPEHLEKVSQAVLTVHRDFGDRTNRKHARLKYVLEEKGVAWFREQVEERAGIKFEAAREFKFEKQGDLYGWHKGVDGKWFFGLFIASGRVKDADGANVKTALRQIADKYAIEFRLTANQNLILAGVAEADKDGINEILSANGVKVENQASVLHANAMACPALPTCGLSLAESERYLPGLIDRIENLLDEVGVGGEEIVIRMTGCPNGCARPYMAELGFVGRSPGAYQVWFGGNQSSTRLNRVWKEKVKDADMETELRPVFERFAKERNDGERFGDWADRTILNEEPANN